MQKMVKMPADGMQWKMADASHLTELHDDVHHVALLVALIVLDDVGVIQAVQHLHLILGLHTMLTLVAAPGVPATLLLNGVQWFQNMQASSQKVHTVPQQETHKQMQGLKLPSYGDIDWPIELKHVMYIYVKQQAVSNDHQTGQNPGQLWLDT